MSLVGALPNRRDVLPAELRSTQVADAVTRVARVHLLEQHQAPGFVQPERLLVLERAHRGDRFETLVERRRAHVGRSGHLLDGDGLGEMFAYPGHGLGDPVHSGLRLSDLGDTSTNRTAQQTNQDLVDHQRSEEVRVCRPGHQIQQSRHRVDDGVGRLPDVEPAIVRRLGDATRVDPRGQFGHARGNQIQLEPEKRVPPTGARHLAGDGQVHREEEHARGVVFEHFTAEHHDLGTLRHDAQRRSQRGVDGLGRYASTPQRIRPREAKRKHTIARSVARDRVGQFSQRHGARSGEADRMLTRLARSGPHGGHPTTRADATLA